MYNELFAFIFNNDNLLVSFDDETYDTYIEVNENFINLDEFSYNLSQILFTRRSSLSSSNSSATSSASSATSSASSATSSATSATSSATSSNSSASSRENSYSLNRPPPIINTKCTKDNLDTEEDCAICFETHLKNDIFITNCNHIFGKSCLKKWLEKKNTCPCCRTYCDEVTQLIARKIRKCSKCKQPGHDKRKCNMIV